jgi:hypothetical protein
MSRLKNNEIEKIDDKTGRYPETLSGKMGASENATSPAEGFPRGTRGVPGEDSLSIP